MKNYLKIAAPLTLCAAIAPIVAAEAKPKRGATKPNVVLLFADDISAREFPIYGSSVWSDLRGDNTQDPALRASTPVMDRLANEGCWINTCWAATVSSPSRAQMMTGRYAHIHKWWENKEKGTYIGETGKEETYPPFASSPLQLGRVAQMGGYATYWAEKTQVPYPERADLYGFDEGFYTPGSLSAGAPHTDFKMERVKGKQGVYTIVDSGEEVETYQQISYYWYPGITLVNDPSCKRQNTLEAWPNTPESIANFGLNDYGPDLAQDFIIDFMERKHDEGKPFFIYHTTHLGHAAYNFLNPETNSNWPGTPVINWDGKNYTRKDPNITGDKGVYDTHGTVTEDGIHRQISYIDYVVWRYMEKFKQMGIDDNTILIIAADNGTSGYGKGKIERQKGVHVPMIIYAPCLNMTKQGEQSALVNVADILPTLAELVGVDIPSDYDINGVSLLPYLTTKSDHHRDYIYAYRGGSQLIRGDKVMRDGYGKWYDMTTNVEDYDSFPLIEDWSKVSEAHRAQRDQLLKELPQYDLFMTERNGPGGTQAPKDSSVKLYEKYHYTKDTF
ncbi:MAG: sulfatase-like hydrolase/transferase [Rikenellaceae bacterium]